MFVFMLLIMLMVIGYIIGLVLVNYRIKSLWKHRLVFSPGACHVWGWASTKKGDATIAEIFFLGIAPAPL
jgi:hypothetical protein